MTPTGSQGIAESLLITLPLIACNPSLSYVESRQTQKRKEAQSFESDVEMTPTGSQGIVQSLCK